MNTRSRSSSKGAATTPLLYSETHGTGDAVLLLPGLGANTESMRTLVDALARSFAVTAVDLKGHGRSPKPPDGNYSVHAQASLVEELIRGADFSNLSIIGHSFGGMVALTVALRLQPPALRRLVLIDSLAYRQHVPLFIWLGRVPGLSNLLIQTVPPRLLVEPMLRTAFYDQKKLTPDLLSSYARPLSMPGGRQALLETLHDLIPSDIDVLTSQYGRISVPTLVVAGREDRVVPLCVAHRLVSELPNARLAVIDEAGHLPYIEQPQLTTDTIVSFLRTT